MPTKATCFVRIEVPADRRVDAVAGDRGGGAHGLERAAGRHLGEVKRRRVVVLFDADAIAVGHDAVAAEPFARCLVKDQMQPPAMDADLRQLIAGESSALLPVDQLAEAVEEAALAVLDAGFLDLRLQAERRQLAHGMGQERDADAELLHLRRALVDAARDAARVQGEREREPANAAADDGDLG